MGMLSKVELLTNLPDNTRGLIEPDDIRDVVDNIWSSYGGLAISGSVSQTFDTLGEQFTSWNDIWPNDGLGLFPIRSVIQCGQSIIVGS